jgi:hypothetical protein
MNKLLLLSIVILAMGSFTGCETTGNPREGGIFWSETKARDRLDERQARLNAIQSDTARVERQNRRLENSLDR